jgi:hypothetical protein
LEKAIDESDKNPIPEAHCYLGRVLYELNELDEAVSELRERRESRAAKHSGELLFSAMPCANARNNRRWSKPQKHSSCT